MQANAESAVAKFFKMLGSKGKVITQPPISYFGMESHSKISLHTNHKVLVFSDPGLIAEKDLMKKCTGKFQIH